MVAISNLKDKKLYPKIEIVSFNMINPLKENIDMIYMHSHA